MAREYAVVRAGAEILYRSPSFDPDAVTERVALSDGAELWISGQDELAQANRELSRALGEARDANAAKEVFLSNMSHDIRTPMNAIIGMTALARKHIDEKARVSDALGKIEVAGSHLLSLINEVLDMSRINSGRLTLSQEHFALGDLLHETLTLTRPQAEQKRHDFRFSTGDILFESLYGDELRLRQIYVNIISNAIKYTNDGGEITLTAWQSTENVQEGECRLFFRCEDNGIGMTPEFLRRVFEPFERNASTTASRVEGTGLGMSIVKKLVDAMRGEITVESEPGLGTTVTVSVPLRAERIQVNVSALEDKRLLILENDAALREVYRRYLGEYGLRYAVASDSAEALAALTDAEFRNDPFHAVVLGRDIGEPGNIYDIASYLTRSYPALTVVLISDHDWNAIEYRANRSGISAFIPIPFFRKSLLNGLNAALQSSSEQDGPSDAPDLRGRHILLVEDNLINREIACELLAMTHAEVDTAENGQEALDRFTASAEGWYDLILMDVQMPVMDGYEATRAIRASGRADAGSIRIFAMTANTFAEDIAKAREAGMDSHLAKPIDINAFMLALRQLR